MKRLLLTVLLCAVLVLPLYADDSLVTSYNPDNSLTLTIEGGTLTVTGRILREGMDAVWVSVGDSTQLSESSVILNNVGSGELFEISVSLSGVTAETPIYVYTRDIETDGEYYWPLCSDVRVVPSAEGFVFSEPPLTDYNRQIASRWVNPAMTFDMPLDGGIRELSDEICAGITNDYDKIFALYRWVAENIHYDWDAYDDLSLRILDPREVLSKRHAVCTGYTFLLEALIEAQRIPAVFVYTYSASAASEESLFGMTRPPRQPNHCHVEAFADGRWVRMDPTWDSRNEYRNGEFITLPPNGWANFDPSEECFAADHVILAWDHEQDPADIPSREYREILAEGIRLGLVPAWMQGRWRDPISPYESTPLYHVTGIAVPAEPDGTCTREAAMAAWIRAMI